jgi:integrase/recombinase XerD
MFDIEKLFEEFITERKYLKNIAPNTERYYRQSFTAYLKYLPNARQLEPNKGILNKWVIAMREAEIKPKSCNTFISAINAFMHWLHENDVIEKRIGATLLKITDQNIESISADDLKRIIAYKPKSKTVWRTHAIVSLLIDTGMRIDEALGAKKSNLDLEQSLITIIGKGGKPRTIPISFEMRKRLFLWLKRRGDNPSSYLFPTGTFNKMDYHNFRRAMKIMFDDIKVSAAIHPHMFRHNYAVNFLSQGGDLFRLSKILGHSDISVTQIYLRSLPNESLSEAHQKLSPLMPKGS